MADDEITKAEDHVEAVLADQTMPLDTQLLERVDRQVAEPLDDGRRIGFLNQLSHLLPMLQQDPTPITELIQRLISPHKVTFKDILRLDPPPDLTLGLLSPSVPINIVTLSLLEKAVSSLEHINYIAGQRDLVAALIIRWLCNVDTGFAQGAGALLAAMLNQDKTEEELDHLDPILDRNLMWRRLFRDEDIYRSVFSICSLSKRGQEGELSKREKTVAQGRLLDLLLSVRAKPMHTTQLSEVEKEYGVLEGGLVEFATLRMIENDDDLMLSSLITFAASYILAAPGSRRSEQHVELEMLKRNSLHQYCISIYLDNTSTHTSWAKGEAAKYLSTYCASYEKDFLNDTGLLGQIQKTLSQRLSNISLSSWMSGRFPDTDLRVLARLPQSALVLEDDDTIVENVWFAPSVAPICHTLSSIFQCSPTAPNEDKASARLIFFLYQLKYPAFWTNLVKAADSIAVLDAAIAANQLIRSVINASWYALPSGSSAQGGLLPTEDWLSHRCESSVALPKTGIETILAENAASQVLPYLLKPATTFNNQVGGGRGDVDSAAWKVAVIKHDALSDFHKRLLDLDGPPELEALAEVAARRLAQGPMGNEIHIGDQVQTLER